MKNICIFLILLMCIGFICANQIEKDKDKEICNDIYYMILQTNWGYSISDLIIIESNNNISNAREYINDYIDYCYIPHYSPILPKKPEIQNETIYNNNNCSKLDTGIDFFDITFPRFNYSVDVDCNHSNSLNYIFRFEQIDGNMYITGIRFWIPLFIFVVIILFFTFKDSGWIKKKVKELKNKERYVE